MTTRGKATENLTPAQYAKVCEYRNLVWESIDNFRAGKPYLTIKQCHERVYGAK